uniref:Uncharacterized protein n=1 Tax=Haptolina ericina TaxID=156174 RepID=A0A7S3AK63_9EUKA|mmetsp:Transcript_22583/g.51060  ORF Transcript_22583/g.51060 Transcript_22583/m.51060 type:complete len:107 (+) Transcript_22583:542-862(+)
MGDVSLTYNNVYVEHMPFDGIGFAYFVDDRKWHSQTPSFHRKGMMIGSPEFGCAEYTCGGVTHVTNNAFSTFTLDDSNCQLGHGALNGDAFGCNNNNGKTSVYLRW